MTRIALFHSVLGVRDGILRAAETFRGAGHEVHIVDQYAGRSFDDYEEAGQFAQSIGYPALMASGLAAVADTTTPFVAAGFSNGAGMAELVTAARGGAAGGVIGSLQFSGALPLAELGLSEWPPNTAVQLHYAAEDPFRNAAWIEHFQASVIASGSPLDAYLDYPVSGHLYTDETLPAEFDAESAVLTFERALEFVDRVGGVAPASV